MFAASGASQGLVLLHCTMFYFSFLWLLYLCWFCLQNSSTEKPVSDLFESIVLILEVLMKGRLIPL